ncbi:MAG: hypothetical protein J6Y94_08530, partial [Bacteriovoracaceae bacterium]|nr:hypothetical protein [Bacteriovoracaceae bacterium]
LLALLTTPSPPRGKEFALADDLRPWLGILLHQVIPSLPDTAIQNFTSNIVARLMQRFPGLTATGPLPDDLRQYFQGQILYLIVLEYFGHWQLAHQEVFFATPTALEPYWQFSLPRDGPRPAAQEATEKLTQLQQAWETQQALWFPAELRQKLVGDAAADRFSYAYLNGQLHALLAQQQYDGQGPTFKWQKQVAFTAPNLGMSIFYHWAAQLVLDFYQHIFQTTAQALYGPFLPGQFDVVGTPSAALALTPQLMEPIFADLWPIIETFNLPQQRDQQGLIQAIFYVGDLLLFNSDGSGALTTPELAQLWPFIYAATNLGKIFWENLAHFCPALDTLLLADGTEDFSYAKDCWHQHFLAILAQLQMTNPNHPIPTIYLEGSANFWQSLQAADQQGNSKRGTDAYLRRLEQVMMIGPDRTEFRFQEILLTSAALLATENFYLRFDLPDENGERNQVLQKDELNAVYRLVRTTIKNNVLPGKDFDEQYARSLFDYVLEKKSLPLNWRGKAKMWWYHHWSQHSALSLTRFDFLDLAIMLKNPDVMTILKRN